MTQLQGPKQPYERKPFKGAGLLEKDHWMTEVNLQDLETISREKEEYWLLAIKATRMAATISRAQTQSILQSAS